MRHAFTSVGTAINHDSIAARQLQFFCDVACDQKQLAKECAVIIRGVGQTWNDLFGHDQHMHRRLRIDIVKNDGVVILPNDFCWDLSCDDFFENGHDILRVLIAGERITVNLRILTLIQIRKLERIWKFLTHGTIQSRKMSRRC